MTLNGSYNHRFKSVFDGKVPQKMFAFRQSSAEDWFDDYTTFVLAVASKIFAKMDAKNAWTYICCNTAWYLNKSQTFKYHKKSTDRDMFETLMRIVKEFVTLVGGNVSYINNDNLAPLYKKM